jgi:N-methylhydantoinase B
MSVVEDRSVAWDGVTRGFKPASPPLIPGVPDHLRLYAGDARGSDIDPIVYELIRFGLLQANQEHGITLQKLCVSPITMIARDFQPSILMADGSAVVLGPYLQYFSNLLTLTVQWILENYSDSVGIRPGDMFLANDPYIGTAHQSDVALLCPIFHEGELFAWVGNMVHHSDVGGPVPGSFCPSARDIWEDPSPFPPIKLIEGGEIREDLKRLFLRQSRLPVNAEMDLFAAIGGNNVAHRRIEDLNERHGASSVHAAMHRLMDAGERSLRAKLETIPDGTWSEVVYNEAALAGDTGLYKYQLNITKKGDRLIIDNEGTEPQAGAISVTYATFVAASLAAVAAQLCYDLAGAFGGAYRLVEHQAIPGTLSCSEWPAPSSAGGYNVYMVYGPAMSALAKMMSAAEGEVQEKAMGVPLTLWNIAVYSGTAENGAYFVGPDVNGLIGALPAGSVRDGLDCGGQVHIPEGEASNVEEYEEAWPIIYWYRRMAEAGAAGAGQYRGGCGFEQALSVHRAGDVTLDLYMNEGFAKTPGVGGSNPGGRCFTRLSGADGGEDKPLQFKGSPVPFEDGDVVTWNWPNAGGFGDPLLRNPDAVVEDAGRGQLDAVAAAEVYGVVLATDDSGKPRLDPEATQQRRHDMAQARLATAKPPNTVAPSSESGHELSTTSFGPHLHLTAGADEGSWACAECEAILGPAQQNYKDGCALIESRMSDLGTAFVADGSETAARMLFREFCCPQCATRIGTEIAREGETYTWDIRPFHRASASSEAVGS